MWSSAWKSKIGAHFIIKLFVSFRGVAAKGLVRNGRPRTHKQKAELRNRLWQDTKLSSFARVFFFFLPAHFPVFTNISFSQVAVWKSCTRRREQPRGSTWQVVTCTVWAHVPVTVLLHMSVFSNLLTGCVSLDYLQKEVIKKETVMWMWCFLIWWCASEAERGELCLGSLSLGPRGKPRWPWWRWQ